MKVPGFLLCPVALEVFLTSGACPGGDRQWPRPVMTTLTLPWALLNI